MYVQYSTIHATYSIVTVKTVKNCNLQKSTQWRMSDVKVEILEHLGGYSWKLCSRGTHVRKYDHTYINKQDRYICTYVCMYRCAYVHTYKYMNKYTILFRNHYLQEPLRLRTTSNVLPKVITSFQEALMSFQAIPNGTTDMYQVKSHT